MSRQIAAASTCAAPTTNMHQDRLEERSGELVARGYDRRWRFDAPINDVLFCDAQRGE